MIDDINRAASQARNRLDQSIRDDDSPMTDLWSQAIEALECARRLCVKAGARPLKVLRVEKVDNSFPIEESIGELAQPGDKAVSINVLDMRSFLLRHKRSWGDATSIYTARGLIEVRASDNVPHGQIEWLG